MAEGRVTPEKELLKLIEGSKINGGAQAQIQTEALKRKVGSLFSFGALIGRLSFLREWAKDRFNARKFSFDIKSLNKMLLICVFILVIYLLANFLLSIIDSKRLLNLKFKIEKGDASLSFPEISLAKPLSYYLEKAKSKNIFSMASQISPKEIVAKQVRSKISELSQDLKLVGISWSDSPDIIIEDKKLQQAFFLKKGQVINECLIKEVFKDRVILSYGGQEVELR